MRRRASRRRKSEENNVCVIDLSLPVSACKQLVSSQRQQTTPVDYNVLLSASPFSLLDMKDSHLHYTEIIVAHRDTDLFTLYIVLLNIFLRFNI